MGAEAGPRMTGNLRLTRGPASATANDAVTSGGPSVLMPSRYPRPSPARSHFPPFSPNRPVLLKQRLQRRAIGVLGRAAAVVDIADGEEVVGNCGQASFPHCGADERCPPFPRALPQSFPLDTHPSHALRFHSNLRSPRLP